MSRQSVVQSPSSSRRGLAVLVNDRTTGQQIVFNSQVEVKKVPIGGTVQTYVDGTPNYDLLRDTFIASRKHSQLLNGLDIDDDELLDDWYCSEDFTQLLIHHFHQATRAAIQDVRGYRVKPLLPCEIPWESKTVTIRRSNLTRADARIQSRQSVFRKVSERS